jgi:hypothetical protein
MVTPLRTRFPFFIHRTMGEVRQTEKLLAKMERQNLSPQEHKRLGDLLRRAQAPERWQPPVRA